MYYPFQFCIHESYTQILPISTPSSHFWVRVCDYLIGKFEIKWYLIESGCCFWRHQPTRCHSFDSYHGTSSVGSLVDLDVFRLFYAITRRILPNWQFLYFSSSVFCMFLRAVVDCVLSREFCESISTGSAQTLYPLLRTLLPDLDFYPLHDAIWECWLRYCKGHLFLEIQAILYHLLILCEWRLNNLNGQEAAHCIHEYIFSTVFLIVTLS